MNKKKERSEPSFILPVIQWALSSCLIQQFSVKLIDVKINLALGVINSTLNSAPWLLALLNAAPANAGHGLMRFGHTGKL